jgi:hypothetical protein
MGFESSSSNYLATKATAYLKIFFKIDFPQFECKSPQMERMSSRDDGAE